jgi:hypothetical protein
MRAVAPTSMFERHNLSSITMNGYMRLEAMIKQIPNVVFDHSSICNEKPCVGELTLGDIYLGVVTLNEFNLNIAAHFITCTLHCFFDDLDFNPNMIFNENESIPFLFKSKHLYFRLARTVIEITRPNGHVLNKGYFIKEIVVSHKRIKILG